MAPTQQDHLGFHLREMAERLDVRSFQALSPGIGLGQLQPGERDRPGFPVEHPMTSAVSEAPMPGASPVHRPQPPTVQAVPLVRSGREKRRMAKAQSQQQQHQAGEATDAPPRPRRIAGVGRMIRRTYCYAIDLALVLLSLGLAVASAAVALSFGDGNEEFWFEGGPMAWLLNFKAWEMAAIVGGVFLMYVLVFRLIAGRTFGESLALSPGKKYRSQS